MHCGYPRLNWPSASPLEGGALAFARDQEASAQIEVSINVAQEIIWWDGSRATPLQ